MFESFLNAPTKIGEAIVSNSVSLDFNDLVSAGANLLVTGWIINYLIGLEPINEIGIGISFIAQTGYGFISNGGLAAQIVK